MYNKDLLETDNMAKYIRIASDLHIDPFGLDMPKISEFILPADERDAESILILAGDISSSVKQLAEFLKEVSKKFERVIAIPGNHEAYGHDINDWKASIRQEIKGIKNIRYAEDFPKCEVFDGVRFIFGILWADGGKTLADQAFVANSLNDFFIIRNGQKRFSVPDMIQEHKRQKKAIDRFLKEPFEGKSVVITHHLPSYRLISERFMPQPPFFKDMNGGFAANFDDILAYDHAPALWIHGHTHDTIDTQLWKTRIICNPAGYRHEKANGFNAYKPMFLRLDEL